MSVLAIAVALARTRGSAAEHAAPASSGTPAQGGACAGDQEPCRCQERKLPELLGQGFAETALRLLASQSCPGTSVRGFRAEALARTGKTAEAKQLAEAVLAEAPGDRGAAHARAIVAIAENKLELARRDLSEQLGRDPSDATARFFLGLAHQQSEHYREARQTYLKLLHEQPKHIDARYQLVLLTHSVGANDEAQHHLAELKRISPIADPRLTSASALLSAPAAASAKNDVARSATPLTAASASR